MPHGPAKAVLVTDTAPTHGPGGSTGAGGISRPSGCPDSRRSTSGSGPCGPGFGGVWQSWQPPIRARYAPRSIMASTAAGGGVGVAAPDGDGTATSSGTGLDTVLPSAGLISAFGSAARDGPAASTTSAASAALAIIA